jgi:hypothetical protein
VFWYGPGSATDRLWSGTDTRGEFIRQGVPVDGTYTPVAGDFDGDGNTDVFWYGPGSATDRLWSGTDTRGEFIRQGVPVDGTYTPIP